MSPVRLFPLIKTVLVLKECTSRVFFVVFDWQVNGLLAGNIPNVYVAVWLEQDFSWSNSNIHIELALKFKWQSFLSLKYLTPTDSSEIDNNYPWGFEPGA